MLDMKQFYNESAAYGLDITVEPDFEFVQNDQLLDLTKTEYNELVEAVNKFLPELDTELLKEMDRYVKANMPDKNLTDITKEDFKVSDMTFKNPKLKKLSESIKKKRIELYLGFNQIFIQLMPYIFVQKKKQSGDIASNFLSVKHMILFSMKNKFLQAQVNNLPTGSSTYVEIKRRKAQNYIDSGKVDHKGEYTIFG